MIESFFLKKTLTMKSDFSILMIYFSDVSESFKNDWNQIKDSVAWLGTNHIEISFDFEKLCKKQKLALKQTKKQQFVNLSHLFPLFFVIFYESKQNLNSQRLIIEKRNTKKAK